MGSLNQSLSKCAMLIVEDDSVSRNALLEILERRYPSLMLHVADNGRAGLDLMRELRPEIVLTDVAMPEMSGNLMAREIRALAPKTQIIVGTAHSDTTLLLDCISIGVNRYLLKPIGHQLLFEAVDDCLSRIELERRVNSQQQELAESGERLRMAMESAELGAWELCPDSGLVFWDERCRTMFGVPVGSTIDYRGALGCIDPEDRPAIDVAVQEAIAGKNGGVYHSEFRVIWGDGSPHWIASHGKVYRQGEGGAVQFIGVNMDITRRKQAEMDLRRHRDHLELLVRERTEQLESRNALLEVEISQRKRAVELLSQNEQRYRAVVEDQTEMISRITPDGSYSFVNDVFCRFFGKSARQLIGRRWQPDAFPDNVEPVKETLGKLSPANPVVTTENRVIAGSGEVRWMQFVNRGIFDGDGRHVETQSVGRDITERKRDEAKLLEYACEVRDLYDNAPCGYHSLDRDGIFVRINDTHLAWLGYERDEIIGRKSFAELLEPESRQRFGRDFAIFLERGSVNGVEFNLVRKDGSRLAVVVDATSVRDKDGNFLMSRATTFDITGRKRAEEEVLSYARRLIEKEEELRKRIAMELHDDIGQELTALGLNLACIGNSLPKQAGVYIRDRLAESRMLTMQIGRTVRDLMTDLLPVQLEEYGLAASVRAHAELFANRTRIAVEVRADHCFPRLEVRHEIALFRIVQEALTNVVKHAGATRVVVSMQVEAGAVRLSVADNGKGFAPGPVRRFSGGGGWGLSNMRERMDLIGGTFRIDSVSGAGTTISMELSEEA